MLQAGEIEMKKYPKLNSDENCAYPEREICNYDDETGIARCKYMKYDNNESIFSSTRWKCTYKKKKH